MLNAIFNCKLDVVLPSSTSSVDNCNMVYDSSMESVSHSSTNTCFLVWNPPEFAVLVTTYFLENLFSLI